MAVAAHVSRVSKEYTPFGYSIMETATASRDVATGGTTPFYVPVYSADDADVYVESASLWTQTALESHAANYWTMSLVKGPSALGSEVAVSGNVAGASTAIAINVLTTMAITGPIVEKGLTLWLKCLPNHGSAPAESLGVIVRLRRKA
jgi:hypothetical protein